MNERDVYLKTIALIFFYVDESDSILKIVNKISVSINQDSVDCSLDNLNIVSPKIKEYIGWGKEKNYKVIFNFVIPKEERENLILKNTVLNLMIKLMPKILGFYSNTEFIPVVDNNDLSEDFDAIFNV